MVIRATRAPQSEPETARRRTLVLLAPVALIAVTYPAFRLADAALGDAIGGQLAWFVGMSFYWAVWGFGFSVWMLGRRRVWELIRPRNATPQAVRHVALVLALAAVMRFLVPGMEYTKATTGAAVLLAISAFANGVFEELLWRGVFLAGFPTNVWLRVVWPSTMFGVWHLVPGSISVGGPQIAMVVGPTLMGFYLAWLSNKTGTVWWAIVAHTLGGLVMVS